MPALKRPRKGSLQFWPRKRAKKFIPSVNWNAIKAEGLLGFITYKVGMATAIVKDNTPKIQSSGKQIAIPVTILEAPNMKVFSLRFYKNGKVVKDLIVSKDKELKRVLKIPKELKPIESNIPQDFDDLRVIVYSLPNQAKIKKTPDLIEIAIGGPNKLEVAKSFVGKEISVFDFIGKNNILDVRGLTKGKGFQGPVKRFGISLRQHKSEKGVRRPGSLGPWHPARVTYYTPQAGQLGMFSRIQYNLKVISCSKISDKNINPKSGFKHYGNIKTAYIIIKGSVQGPPKRQVLVTPSFRKTPKQTKSQYELVEVITR